MRIPIYEECVRRGNERHILRGIKNRTLQLLAQFGPGGITLRARLHRLRGVKIGQGVFIGYDVVIDTSFPELVSIGDYSIVAMRTTIVGHFKIKPELLDPVGANESGNSERSVRIGNDVFIGAGAIILPNVTIGDGSVVTAGSVVTRSVEPLTMVQGNPAEPVARCGLPLTRDRTIQEFTRNLLPL